MYNSFCDICGNFSENLERIDLEIKRMFVCSSKCKKKAILKQRLQKLKLKATDFDSIKHNELVSVIEEILDMV